MGAVILWIYIVGLIVALAVALVIASRQSEEEQLDTLGLLAVLAICWPAPGVVLVFAGFSIILNRR